MNMDTAKKFITKIIDRTKSKKLQWHRLADNRPGVSYPFDVADINFYDSYCFDLDNSSNVYLVKDEDEDIYLYLSPGNSLPTQNIFASYDCDDEVLAALGLRLYNLVYSLFPNIDSVMEDFINLED